MTGQRRPPGKLDDAERARLQRIGEGLRRAIKTPPDLQAVLDKLKE